MAGESRSVCDPGQRAGVHRTPVGQPLRGDGPALARDRAAAARGDGGDAGVSEEILVNVTPRETRVAVVENGMLQELHIERSEEHTSELQSLMRISYAVF